MIFLNFNWKYIVPVLVLVVGVIGISGCTENNTKYEVSDSQFELQGAWNELFNYTEGDYRHSFVLPNDDGNISLNIEQFNNTEEYKKLFEERKAGTDNLVVFQNGTLNHNETINGINVIVWERWAENGEENGPLRYIYLFEKNNKMYTIDVVVKYVPIYEPFSENIRQETKQLLEKQNGTINEAIKTIVTTIQ